MENLYIGDLKQKEMQGGEDTDAMEHVILTLLFPNATMFGGERESLFYTSTFLPFVSVVKTVSMFIESTGCTGKLSEVHFLTCAPVAEGIWLSLSGLVAAFQGSVWLTLGIAAVVSGLALHTCHELSQYIKMERNVMPKFYGVFVCDVLLCQGAPLPIKRVETFGELFSQNFSIHSSVTSSYQQRMLGFVAKGIGSMGQSKLGGKNGNVGGEWPETVFTKLFIRAHFNLGYRRARAKAWKIEKYQRKVYKTMEDMASTRDMNYFFEVLAKCGQDAFVASRDTLDRTKLRLKKRLEYQPKLIEQLTMSKDSYGELIEKWKFANIPWSASHFLIRTHSLLESGLIPLWKGWIHWVGTVEDHFKMWGSKISPRPLTAESLKIIEQKQLAKKQRGNEEPVGRTKKPNFGANHQDVFLRTGTQLPKHMRLFFTPDMMNIPLEDLDPFYAETKTFVVITRNKVLHRFSANLTLNLFSPFNSIRRTCIALLHNTIYRWLMIFLAILDCTLLVQSRDEINGSIFDLFGAIYAFDFVVSVIARGLILDQFTVLRDGWGRIDLGLLLPYFLSASGGYHLFSGLRALKIASLLPSLKSTVEAAWRTVKDMRDIFVWTFFTTWIFALVGRQLFMGVSSQKCVRDFPEDGTEGISRDIKWRAWVSNSTNWRECPENYTCLQGHENDDLLYGSIGRALMSTTRLMQQDSWEHIYPAVSP
ncbi:unnamed protein product [Orchesella dallaii]|uniref:Ion transport domain-containing protein n=1 Tax=Orchesella dallaii TaxID=48710 RepID=A0ABP1PZU8_9HEXA